MKREFGYDWVQMVGPLLAVPCVVAYIYWKEGGALDTPLAIFLFVIIIGALLKQAFPLCKVTLSEQEIHLNFLLPFRRGGSFLLDQIEGYGEMSVPRKNERIPIGGFVQPRGQKPIMLLRNGTKNFRELNALLKETFPKIQDKTEQKPSEVPAKGAVDLIKFTFDIYIAAFFSAENRQEAETAA